MAAVVSATGLVKRYKDVIALDHLDLEVEEGTVLGLLGPNGAGKTTAVSILTTLLTPDAGQATVAGVDVVAEPKKVRERIGLSGQFAAVDEHLTGYENLEMIGRLYHLGRTRARARAHELLERFDLTESAQRPVKGYSGGMRRRLDLAGALVAAPPVLFLDEPTTGLDPRSRTDLWEVIRELTTSGTTVLLTTQYLEEADQLAHQILVIDHGKAIAQGTADQLKAKVGDDRIEITLADPAHAAEVIAVLGRFASGPVVESRRGRAITAPINGGVSDLAKVIEAFNGTAVSISEIGLRRPTLDDVFLTLTGRSAADMSVDTDGEGELE